MATEGDVATQIERALAHRAAICWVRLQHAELLAAQTEGASNGHIEFLERRLTLVQKRYTDALRSLAMVRRLRSPAVRVGVAGQVNVAERQVNVGPGAATAPIE